MGKRKMMAQRQNHRKAALVTLGCPKNQVDSEVLAGELVRGGLTLVGRAEEADLIFINTCAFIEEAKQESVNEILRAVELKKNGKGPKVYVWGCLPQRYREDLKAEIPELDGLFGVEPYEEMGRFLFNRSYRWSSEAFNRRILSTPPHTAYLKIADGCDHRCTFCAIPGIKGRYRSRAVNSLVEEAAALADKGVKELILIAQDTTAYGLDLEDGSRLITLLEKLVSVEGIRWIRLLYSHPAHLTDEIIEFMANEDKICRYIDLPLQHISDDMLRRMGRGMGSAAIKKLIHRLRKRIPGLVLRTAFIVGFPGETNAMFEELLDFVREARFQRLGAFVFSSEEGTEAHLLRPRVPKRVAEERYRMLMEVQQDIASQLNRTLESEEIPVIVDGYDTAQDLYRARSEGDAPDIDQTVWIKGKARVGDIVSVRVEVSSAYDLVGRVV